MPTPSTTYLKDYRQPDFFIEKTDLTFEINDENTIVTSTLKIIKNTDVADKNTSLILDKEEFEILSVFANEMLLLPGEYETGEDYFKLYRTPEEFELEIKTKLEPKTNTSLEGLYMSGNIICTQCEAQGFRKITPFLDRPDVMSVYSCTIIADKKNYPILLSNGNIVQSGDLEQNRHFVKWEDPFKKPSYLFALVAGDLSVIEDQFTTKSGRRIDLKIYSEHDNIQHCTYAMTSLKDAMKWDENRFNLEYDLDLYQIVAINDFNAGAMENKGLNIFNSKYVIADTTTATDDDFMGVQGVIGHEYFHNWTGNRVTLKNWFQLSLKEGLTVFRDQEFSSDLNSRGVKRIADVRNLRAFQFPEDAGPMTHPVRPDSYIKMDNFYTMTVYEKGAELVRMIHQFLGEKLFQKGMDLYFERYDGMAVTIEDFVGVMEKVSDFDFTQFKLWYVQSGTPTVKLKRDYAPEKKQLTLSFEQSVKPDRNESEKKPFHIPVKFGIIDPSGKDITPPDQTVLELKNANEQFVFYDIPEGSLPSVFRQFSAPIKLESDFTDSELAFLMAKDSDDFNRWDASQTLFLKEIKRLVFSIQAGQEVIVNSDLINAFKTAVINKNTDKAFLAKMLTLPFETELKDQFDLVDVDAIHSARTILETAIASKTKDELLQTIEECATSNPSDISQTAMANRSLKNLSLSFLGSLKQPETTKLVLEHFNSARNMTDKMSTFKILSNIDEETKKQAVDSFYSQWKNHPLVLDKWFSIQAASTLPDTLDIVKTLTNHKHFSIKNPNKVRSLIYVFALHNPLHFNGIAGKGYQFVADHIIELDKINHQVAARLASCFNHWKKYDVERQALMKKELESILQVQTLSKNVYEIVSRALA